MKINNKDLLQYDALVFDLDGTLLDSMPLHNKAWIDTFAEHGLAVTKQMLRELAGLSSPKTVQIMNERFGLSLDPESISEQKREKYQQHLTSVQIIEPVFAIVKEFYGKVPLGIVTGGSHGTVDGLLKRLELDQYFVSIICSDDTIEGKETNVPYNLVAKNLGVSPKKCVFFDDGDIGLKGATSAGMDVIHVDTENPKIFV